MAGSPPERMAGQPRLILVVEDEVLIALDLAGTLEDEGYRVLGPGATVAAALRLLGEARPDAAVLDMSLRGEMVTPVARLLREMGVPFVLASAYERKLMPDDEALAGVAHLGKPMDPARLLAAMSDLVGQEAG